MDDLIDRQPTQKNDSNVLDAFDCVRKQDAINEIARWKGYLDEDMITRIQIGLNRLPSAQPERKTGKWKIKTINTFEMAYGSTGYEPVYECSVCGRVELDGQRYGQIFVLSELWKL